jgi:hypothetical protein
MLQQYRERPLREMTGVSSAGAMADDDHTLTRWRRQFWHTAAGDNGSSPHEYEVEISDRNGKPHAVNFRIVSGGRPSTQSRITDVWPGERVISSARSRSGAG